jgi:hypothetical protein
VQSMMDESLTKLGARDETLSNNTSSMSFEKPSREDDRPSDENHTRPDIMVSPESSAKTISPPVDAPPDGGLRAWLVVAGAFCSMFVSFGWINCTFPAQAEERKHH